MKKGLVASTVVVFVIAIVGFIMALLVFSQFMFNEEIDRQLCHTSVITRATMPNTAGAQGLIPLKCPTQKICVGGNDLFGNPNCRDTFGEDPENLIKLEIDNYPEIEKYISQEMVECWEMMGEGKVSLFSQYWANEYNLGAVYPTCVVCSRIAFDKKSLDDKNVRMEEIDVLDYMFKHQIPGKDISYYEYFYGERGEMSIDKELIISEEDVKNIDNSLRKAVEANRNTDGSFNSDFAAQNYEILNDDKDLSEPNDDKYQEIAVVFMQISASDSYIKPLVKSLLTAYGAGVSGKMILPKRVSSAIKIPFVVHAIFGVGLAGVEGFTYLNNREVTAGYCGDVSVGDDSRSGCSVVRAINYNSEDLLKYCSVIESIDS